MYYFPYFLIQGEDADKLEDAMGGIFHTKAFDYGNMGGVPSRGAASAAQVDSGATFYRPAKTSKKEEKKKKKEEKAKVKQAVPQIGAIGAFAAMSGGLIGAATMAQGSPKAQRANLEKKSSADADQEKVKNEKKFKKSFKVATTRRLWHNSASVATVGQPQQQEG